MKMTDNVTAIVPSSIKSFIDKFPGNQIFVALKDGSPAIELPGTLENSYKRLKDLNKSGYDIYFTVNEPKATTRKAEDIVKCRALFLDDDTVQATHRTDLMLKPSIIVETSKGKYHYYWLTETEDKDAWIKCIKSMIFKYNTDKQVCDPPRILRLPGFINHKTGDNASIVSLTSQTYDWAKISSTYPPLENIERISYDELEKTSTFVIAEAITDFVTGKHITNPMNSFIMSMAARGYKRGSIIKQINGLFDSVPNEVYDLHEIRYKKARAQVNKFIKTALRKVQEDNLPEVDPTPIADLENITPTVDIPHDAVPSVLLNAALSSASTNATHKDPAIISGMVVASTLLGKNVNIQVQEHMFTNCNIGIAIAARSGARKTSIYKHMNQPFFEYENNLVKQWNEMSNTRAAEIRLLNKQINKAEKEYDKMKDASERERMAATQKIAKDLERMECLKVTQPSLHTVDVTQERLIQTLERNSCAMGIISDDARQVISNMLGDYREKSTGEGIYIAGITNGDYKYERKGEDKIVTLEKICLNALLFVQPDKARELMSHPMYVESGLAARLPVYFYQFDGIEMLDNTSWGLSDPRDMDKFYNALKNLQSQRFRTHPPVEVRLSDNAIRQWTKFHKDIAEKLRTDWFDQYESINKICTQSVIYATIFAAIEDKNLGLAIRDLDNEAPYMLSAKYLVMGQKFAVTLFSHCLESLNSISEEGIVKYSKLLLRSIQTQYNKERRAVANGVQVGRPIVLEGFGNRPDFRRVISTHKLRDDKDKLAQCLDKLVETSWIFPQWTDHYDRRRNPGPDNRGIIYRYNYDGAVRIGENYGSE